MKRILSLSILLLVTCSQLWLWSWGERGHHVVASTAAQLVGELAPESEGGRAVGRFFRERSITMGHLSNIPDISWRDATNRRVAYLNSPHHYFGPERLMGPPPALQGQQFEAYLARIRREIPANYRDLKESWEEAENALPGAPQAGRLLRIYEDLGVTPWRTQELYNLLVEAFRCAQSKESRPAEEWAGAYAPVESPFAESEPNDSQVPLPTYRCRDELSRRSDLFAAVVLAGIMAHFIGDQVQPYHPTADYDGWVTGNGGIHAYFESEVVRALDPLLARDVLATALDPDFRRETWRRVGTPLKEPWGVAQLLINVGADALSKRERVRQIDDDVAIRRHSDKDGSLVLAHSARLRWGDHPMFHEERVPNADRLGADTPKVQKAFRPLIVERLATSATVLATTWLSAWDQAGQPQLDDQNAVSLPYPVNPPFIWPTFDREALQRSLQP